MTIVGPFAQRLLTETREEIHRADAKAGLLLATAGVVGSVGVGGVVGGDLVLADTAGWVQATAALAAAALVVGVVLFGMAVWPAIGAAEPGKARYFLEHAQYDGDAGLKQALITDAASDVDRDVQQLRVLGQAVKRKYRFTRWGEAAVALAITLGAVSAVLHWRIR